MFDSLSLPVLLLIFAASAGAVWVAGTRLSKATDVLADRFGLGEALGGLMVLAIVTNLPEIAITISAALGNKLDLAVGNILGGIAIQTVVLVILDVVGVGTPAPLTYRAASLELVLEGILVLAVLTVVVMGHQLPATLIVDRVAPGDLLIVVLWAVGVYLIAQARGKLPWQEAGYAPEAQPRKIKKADNSSDQADQKQQGSTSHYLLVFGVGALVTLIGGVLLEQTGDAIAGQMGMSGVLFGATILAAATALPEVSTGLEAVRLGDYRLAVSDILGGNAFLPVLFLLATVISGKSVLPMAQKTDIYLTGLGMLLTTVYLYGLIFRPRGQILAMGYDSFIVLVLYLLGLTGLFFISGSH